MKRIGPLWLVLGGLCFLGVWSWLQSEERASRLRIEVLSLETRVVDLQRDNKALLGSLNDNSPVFTAINKAIKEGAEKQDAERAQLSRFLNGSDK
jgi:hypothetical protein